MSLRARLFYVLLACLPKRQAAVVHTWPSFDDTAQALIPELEKTGLKRIHYLAAGEVGGPVPQWGRKVRVLPKRSWRGLCALLTSRWVFTTHQCYTSAFPKRVESVNLWHGMPIKRIGWMVAKPVNVPRYKVELATSEFWQPIIRDCMKPWGKVLVNGLPRYDRLGAMSRDEVRRRLGGAAVTASKVVVWLPTYRQTVKGDSQSDGTNLNNAAQFAGFDAGAFEGWLAARNLVCVMKPHPLGPMPEARPDGYLRILDDREMAKLGLTLYSLLGGADALITDVSSVYVDFLLLNRPLIHAFSDRMEYQSSRGFTFDWSEEYLAGPWVANMSQLQAALTDLSEGRDQFADRRARLRALFHVESGESASLGLLRQLDLLPRAQEPSSGQ